MLAVSLVFVAGDPPALPVQSRGSSSMSASVSAPSRPAGARCRDSPACTSTSAAEQVISVGAGKVAARVAGAAERAKESDRLAITSTCHERSPIGASFAC